MKEVAAVPAALAVEAAAPVALDLEAALAEMKEVVQDLDPKAALVLEAAKVALAEVALVNLAARALAEALERLAPQNN